MNIFTHTGMTPENSTPVTGFDLPPYDPGDPATWRSAAERLLEFMLDRQIELITALDLLETDPDLEPDGTEEDWAFLENHVARAFVNTYPDEDVEIDDHGEDGGDDEPSLGSLTCCASFNFSQERWNGGGSRDLEHNVEDEGEQVNEDGGDILSEPHDDDFGMGGIDSEPSLSLPEWRMNQANLNSGNDSDLEADYVGAYGQEGGFADAEPDNRNLPGGKVCHRPAPPMRDGVPLNPIISPSLFPPRYAMICAGKCMEPEIPDRSRLVFERDGRCEPGDLVAIFLRPETVPAGQHSVLVKRLVMDLRKGDLVMLNGKPGIMARMINPPRVLCFNAEDIIGMHKCTGIADAETPRYRVTDGDMLATEALRLRAAG